MSRIIEEFRRDDTRMFDRLADGELSDRDRRELLSSLDDEPGAWRRCALAFLEAQTWRHELADFRARPVERAAPVEPAAAIRWVRLSAFGLALAASLLVAFGLGMKVAGTLSPQVTTARSGGSAEKSVVTAAPDDLAVNNDWADEGSENSAAPRFQTFKLAVDDGTGGNHEDIEVPFVEATSVDPEWLQQQSSAVPAAVRQALEQAGLEIRQQRRLWPITLNDGRRLIVPVEQVEVQDVAGHTY